MERLRTGEIREFEMEKRLFHKDGRDIWIKLTVSPMCMGCKTGSSHHGDTGYYPAQASGRAST